MKKNRILSLALCLAMVSSMVVGVHASQAPTENNPASATQSTTAQGEYNNPTINVKIPSQTSFLINPYGLKTAPNNDGKYYDDQIISPTYVVKNLTQSPLDVKVSVTAELTSNSKLAFVNVAPEDETKTKAAFVYLGAGNVYSYDDELADAGFDVENTTEEGYKGPVLVSTAEQKTTLCTLAGNDPAVKGDFGFMGIRFFGSVAKNPSEDWSGDDNATVKITWTFIGAEDKLPDVSGVGDITFTASDALASAGTTKVLLVKKADIAKIEGINSATPLPTTGGAVKKTSDGKNFVVSGLKDNKVDTSNSPTQPIEIRAAGGTESPFTEGDIIAVIQHKALSEAVLNLASAEKVTTEDGAIIKGTMLLNKEGSTTETVEKSFKICLQPHLETNNTTVTSHDFDTTTGVNLTTSTGTKSGAALLAYNPDPSVADLGGLKVLSVDKIELTDAGSTTAVDAFDKLKSKIKVGDGATLTLGTGADTGKLILKPGIAAADLSAVIAGYDVSGTGTGRKLTITGTYSYKSTLGTNTGTFVWNLTLDGASFT